LLLTALASLPFAACNRETGPATGTGGQTNSGGTMTGVTTSSSGGSTTGGTTSTGGAPATGGVIGGGGRQNDDLLKTVVVVLVIQAVARHVAVLEPRESAAARTPARIAAHLGQRVSADELVPAHPGFVATLHLHVRDQHSRRQPDRRGGGTSLARGASVPAARSLAAAGATVTTGVRVAPGRNAAPAGLHAPGAHVSPGVSNAARARRAIRGRARGAACGGRAAGTRCGRGPPEEVASLPRMPPSFGLHPHTATLTVKHHSNYSDRLLWIMVLLLAERDGPATRSEAWSTHSPLMVGAPGSRRLVEPNPGDLHERNAPRDIGVKSTKSRPECRTAVRLPSTGRLC
jgi:hypothetical protein